MKPLAQAITILVTSYALVGCGGHHITEASKEVDASIEECDAYLSAYEHCLASLGPAEIARDRVEQARNSFRERAGKGKEARVALRQECAANLTRLEASCH